MAAADTIARGLASDDDFYAEWVALAAVPDPRTLFDESLADK